MDETRKEVCVSTISLAALDLMCLIISLISRKVIFCVIYPFGKKNNQKYLFYATGFLSKKIFLSKFYRKRYLSNNFQLSYINK